MRKVVLFDMDGTLTPARKEMPRDITCKLFELHNAGYEIGIISGSDKEYILDQCKILFDMFGERLTSLHLYPCNGTKYYKWQNEDNELKHIYEYSIKGYLGGEKLKRVLSSLLKYQIDVMRNYEFSNRLNFTGTFIDYRESLINWCPIGRNADTHDRLIFKDTDEYFKIRKKFAKILEKDPVYSGLTVKIGGDTSFDIFPHGWDKTFPIEIANKKSNLINCELYFVGDRCEEGGNDKELYELVRNIDNRKSFKTKSTENTLEIINNSLTNKY